MFNDVGTALLFLSTVAEENSEILNEQANYELTRTGLFSFIH